MTELKNIRLLENELEALAKFNAPKEQIDQAIKNLFDMTDKYLGYVNSYKDENGHTVTRNTHTGRTGIEL